MKSSLDTTHEITKLIKYSPRRDAIFQQLKSQLASDGPGVRVMCPIRWTVRADSLHGIISNWPVLTQLWEESLEIAKDSETVARIRVLLLRCTALHSSLGLN